MYRDGQDCCAIARAHLHTRLNTFRRAINRTPNQARLDLSQITRLRHLLELTSDAI